MSDLPRYDGWEKVPAHLFTATRLKSLDLPRRPGPAVATVEGGDYRGKSDVFALYGLADSPPTGATAGQLETAAARRKFAACTGCGAHPDEGLSQVTGRCEACLHVERLREAQVEARGRRDEYRVWAAERVADSKTLVAWIDEHIPPSSPSGRPRKPVAHTLAVVTPGGESVLSLSYRLADVGPRVRAVPEGAIAYEEGCAAVAGLGERYFVCWGHGDLWRLVYMSTGRNPAYLGSNGAEMDGRVRSWRGDIDPRSVRLRAAVPPGNAERLALLLRRMAADTTDGGSHA